MAHSVKVLRQNTILRRASLAEAAVPGLLARAANASYLAALVLVLGATSAGMLRAAEPPAVSETMQRWALLIGVEDYSELPDVEFVGRDLERLQTRLIAAGFPLANVFCLHGHVVQGKYLPSKANIERQLEIVPKLAGPKDLVLIVFCGHGLRLGEKDWLCPLDAHLGRPAETLIALEEVRRQLAASEARHKLLVIDVARADLGKKEAVDGFLQSLAAPAPGIVMLAGCRAGETSALDRRQGYGVFLEALARGLEGAADRERGNRDGRTSLAELAGYLRTATSRAGAATQTPLMSGGDAAVIDLGEVPRFMPAGGYFTVDGGGPVWSRVEALSSITPQSLNTYNQALLACARGDFGEAITLSSNALEQDPRNAWACWLRAMAHRNRGEIGMAAADFGRLGIPLPCRVTVASVELKVGSKTVATLKRGDRIYVTKGDGEWLWVHAVWNDESQKGWIPQEHVR